MNTLDKLNNTNLETAKTSELSALFNAVMDHILDNMPEIVHNVYMITAKCNGSTYLALREIRSILKGK